MLGFQDECWWTRLAQPTLSSWAGGQPLRLRADAGGMMLRFCDGRPVSATAEDFLGWVCRELAAEGKKVLALVWDNAAWHVSRRVRAWIARHNRRASRAKAGCRIRVCGLPVKAPWLNPIEPKWVHGKRAVVEPGRKLTAEELRQRACDYYGCRPEPLLATGGLILH